MMYKILVEFGPKGAIISIFATLPLLIFSSRLFKIIVLSSVLNTYANILSDALNVAKITLKDSFSLIHTGQDNKSVLKTERHNR